MNKNYFEKYNYKILSLKELKNKIGGINRKKKVIMCHGVFDVVHPGHVRHLAYAKSCADILVVSITADVHINKGIYRPHVPQKLRAINVSAFEMVDYVIIDMNKKPLNNINYLKPNFFAKGFEYTANGLPKATQEEIDELEKYGGRVIFTPGDIVYSSSKFLNESLPNIELEKLLILMKSNKLSFDVLKKDLDNLNKTHVHVIGDIIIDSYTRTNLIGGQIKTPTLSVLFNKKDNYIGGAGIVAKHLKAAGAKVTLTTVLGNDDLKDLIIKDLKKEKIKVNQIIDSSRPTINKNVIIADGYRILKIDTLKNQPISDKITKQIISSIKNSKADAYALCDFRHGLFHSLNIHSLSKSIPSKSFKVADSQVATRWGNITDFKNFDLITPNEREARFSLADQDSTIGQLSKKLFENTNCKNLILKLGSRGSLCVSKKGRILPAHSVPSFCENLLDAVGAGDAYLAYSTLMMVTSKNLVKSSIIGSIAASCECEIDGNIPITIKDIKNKLFKIEDKLNYKSQ